MREEDLGCELEAGEKTLKGAYGQVEMVRLRLDGVDTAAVKKTSLDEVHFVFCFLDMGKQIVGI